MRIQNILLAAALTASSAFSAILVTTGGTTVANEGQFSLVAGATTVDFNNATSCATIVTTGATYSCTGNPIAQGSQSGITAAPPNDTSKYLSVGDNPSRTPVTITFDSMLNYFGFYVGSMDDYNTIAFYNGNTLIKSMTGTEIAQAGGFGAANGSQASNYFVYVNLFATTQQDQFNKIVMSSSQNAFETDNHAFGVAKDIPSDVPEPATFLTLIPAIAFFHYRRKR